MCPLTRSFDLYDNQFNKGENERMREERESGNEKTEEKMCVFVREKL